MQGIHKARGYGFTRHAVEVKLKGFDFVKTVKETFIEAIKKVTRVIKTEEGVSGADRFLRPAFIVSSKLIN